MALLELPHDLLAVFLAESVRLVRIVARIDFRDQ
jgi:hypothetical protein